MSHPQHRSSFGSHERDRQIAEAMIRKTRSVTFGFICVHLWLKTKNPPPCGSGLINLVNESNPDCRAGQQRPALRDKQQV
jgi:hypothetical protein